MQSIGAIMKQQGPRLEPTRNAVAEQEGSSAALTVFVRAGDAQEQGRDYAAERKAAQLNTTERIVDLAVARQDQSLGEEHIKLAQAMILCTLPHSATTETKITRRARMGDGSMLSVTFSAAADGVGMPFGADRKLLFWLLDRAIRLDSPFIPWSSAAEYQKEVGMEKGGRSNQQLRERFARIAGLVISIARKGAEATALNTFPLIERAYLPNSIAALPGRQANVLETRDRFGVMLHPPLFADIKKHNTVMPRRLWLDIKGPTAVQDMVFWFFYRCYQAASETTIPWTALKDQFPSGDSNPYRLRQHARQAIKLLKVLWPEAQIREAENGIRVDKARVPMLDDDSTCKRVRRL